MKELTTSELNNLFIDTIQRCTYDLINRDDEEIEYEILEEFDTGAISFLHKNSLNRLLKNNFINENIRDLSIKLRDKYLAISEEKRNAEAIRTDNQWREIFNLSNIISKEKTDFDIKKK